MADEANIDGLKAGVAGEPDNNPYKTGTEEYDSRKAGYRSGVCAGEEYIPSDAISVWNE